VVRTVRRRTEVAESYCLSAALVTLLVFSASRFQLPHYTNVIFPFLAIITARWIHGIATKGQERFYAVTQYGTMLLSIVAVVAVQWIFRPAVNLVPFLGLALAAVIGFVGVSRAVADRTLVVFYRTCLAAVLLSGYLQLVAYPGLLRYQSGTHAAALANAAYEGQEVLELGVNSYPLIFHLRGPVREVDFEAVARAAAAGDGPALVYTAATAIPQLEGLGLTVEVLGTFEHYHIPKLSGRFLDHRRRGGEVQARVLLRVGPGSSASEARPGLSSSA